MLRDVELNDSCGSGFAKTIRGKILHLGATSAARLGRGVMAELNKLADGTGGRLTPAARLNIAFLRAMVLLPFPRVVPLDLSFAARSFMWSDASFHTSEDGIAHMRICAIAVVPRLAFRGGVVFDVPAEAFQLLKPRKSQIFLGELFGQWMGFYFFGELFRQTELVGFVDNMGAVHALVKGTSGEEDAAAIAWSISYQLVLIQCRSWWEWAGSPSNVADGGSRVGTTDAVAANLSIWLARRVMPPLPVNFPWSAPQHWRAFRTQSNRLKLDLQAIIGNE